jgi:hypothetical protein
MSQEVTFEVGDLYAELHNQYSESLGKQYEEQLRQQFEEFVHNFNQQVEREQEKLEQQQSDGLNLSEEELDEIEQQ